MIKTSKTGVYYNTEGRPQKTQRALIGPNLSREDWKIVRILFHSLDKLALYETKSQLVTAMSKLLPSSYYANSWFKTTQNSRFSLFGLHWQAKGGKSINLLLRRGD